jgi:pimeloyl-ACP methyl ester carboxylesterase
VVASAAYRLGPVGKQVQLDLLDGLERTGRFHADELAVGITQNRKMQRLLRIPMRLVSIPVRHPADPISVLRAEDKFDVHDRLPQIATETLVICGARDSFWTPEMFAETAHRLPRGELITYSKRGHNIVTSKRFAADVVAFLSRSDDPR